MVVVMVVRCPWWGGGGAGGGGVVRYMYSTVLAPRATRLLLSLRVN